MNDESVEFLRKCIEFYSPSGEEKEYSEFLCTFLENSGFQVNYDKIGNVIAEKGKGKPHILLVSHMDTIPGELPVKEEDGKIYGRGAVDCKPSLAAMVYSIAKFDFKSIKEGKITFAGIVREEDSLIGINTFLDNPITPDYAVFGEPTTIEQICIGYKGRYSIELEVATKSGHVASSWQYQNAIESCLEIWDGIKLLSNELTEESCLKGENKQYFHKVIPNLTKVSGGILSNCVPPNCKMVIDIRFPPEISKETINNEVDVLISKIKDKYSQQGNFISLDKRILSSIDGFEIRGTELVVGALRWAIFKTIKKKPILVKKTGTTFINQIGITLSIPSITFGPGDPKLEHTENEFINIKEYRNSLKIYQKFLKKLVELYERQKK